MHSSATLAAAELAGSDQAASNRGRRIGILVIAYNAVTTLSRVLKRIPAPVWSAVEQVAIFDDASQDATYELAVGLKAISANTKLHVLKHERNLGYGGNQKAGYRYFIEQGFDAVVLLHGDGQYAPELLAAMYRDIVSGQADAVFGSRMMADYGGPLKGGMPLYKYLGNKTLSFLENRALGLNLTEFHSGYRAYSLHALAQIDFSRMTDDFHFDTEIIIKLHHQGFRIRETPIPTFYGDEIYYVNGLKYAGQILRAVYRYDRTRRSIRRYPEFAEYWIPCRVKTSPRSSHDFARRAIAGARNVLALGEGTGEFAAELAGLADAVNQTGRKYDRILLLNYLEHLSDPEAALGELSERVAERGRVLVVLPNVANIWVRLSLAAGRFDYEDRGILDGGHLRFFTRASARRMLARCGYRVLGERMTVIPVEMAIGGPRWLAAALRGLLAGLTAVAPGLFGYEMFLEAAPAPPQTRGST